VELVFLKDVFGQKGYSDRQIHGVLNCHVIMDNKPSAVTFLLYVGPVFNRISRVLAQYNIRWACLT
jgi:hypothetical protein